MIHGRNQGDGRAVSIVIRLLAGPPGSMHTGYSICKPTVISYEIKYTYFGTDMCRSTNNN